MESFFLFYHKVTRDRFGYLFWCRELSDYNHKRIRIFFITTKEYIFSQVEFELGKKEKGQLTQNKRKPCQVDVCEKIVK